MVRVAVVESDPALAEQLERTLSERGDAVTRFTSGAVALLKAQSGSFELLIAGVDAPGLDGISLCKALREHMGKQRLPILLLADEEAGEAILRALEAEANDCLLTPFSARELRAKIAACLRARDEPPPATKIAIREDLQQLPAPFGEYVLEEVLGQGGFGAVFRARRHDGTPVALKMLHPFVNDDRSGLARFFREVALLARLDCPQIVQILDTGFEQGRFYLAMTYLPGRSAAELLERAGKLDAPQVARIGLDVHAALQAMHSRGIVHRDVKPANIIVAEDRRATLVDLGLAKEVRDRGLTASRELVGTLAYLAPEVVREGKQTAASDLYSCGACLYQLLTGKVPFRARSTMRLLTKIVSDARPTSLASLRPDAPPELCALIEQLLDADPAVREAARIRETLEPLAALG